MKTNDTIEALEALIEEDFEKIGKLCRSSGDYAWNLERIRMIIDNAIARSKATQRPTHLTLDNVDEWLPQAKEVLIAKDNYLPEHRNHYGAGWAPATYVLIKQALREGCTVEVLQWREE